MPRRRRRRHAAARNDAARRGTVRLGARGKVWCGTAQRGTAVRHAQQQSQSMIKGGYKERETKKTRERAREKKRVSERERNT